MRRNNYNIQLIHQVVRGERPCTDLSCLGIKLEITDGNWQIESPHLEAVRVRVSDIVHGLLKYQSNTTDLKKWASLVMGCNFIDLSECESQASWDVLLNALWDSAYTGAFSPTALKVAQEMAE